MVEHVTVYADKLWIPELTYLKGQNSLETKAPNVLLPAASSDEVRKKHPGYGFGFYFYFFKIMRVFVIAAFFRGNFEHTYIRKQDTLKCDL